MSIYPLPLEGFDVLSTWGEDHGAFYAQVTSNGKSDRDGPEFWIAPPDHPTVRTRSELAAIIAEQTGLTHESVVQAMEDARP